VQTQTLALSQGADCRAATVPHNAQGTSLTPSKRSAATDAADLKELLSMCTNVLCDPTLASPFRRTLHKTAHRALTDAAKKAEALKNDELHPVVHTGVFESKAGHEHNPQYSPARKKSASEQCTARKQARLAAQLTVGQSELQYSSFKKAQNDRRVPHRLQDRSKQIQQRLDAKSTSKKTNEAS
jgi:hypothetical protein